MVLRKALWMALLGMVFGMILASGTAPQRIAAQGPGSTPAPITGLPPITPDNAGKLGEVTRWSSNGFPVAVSPDGKILGVLSGSNNDLAVMIYDLSNPNGAPRQIKIKDAAQIEKNSVFFSIGFSPDMKLLIATGALRGPNNADVEGIALAFDADTGKQIAQLRTMGQLVTSLTFSPDGKLVAIIGEEKNGNDVKWAAWIWGLQLIRQASQRPLRLIQIKSPTVAFSPDSQLIAAPDDKGAIQIFEVVAGGKNRGVLTADKETSRVIFAPKGNLLIALSDRIRVWDFVQGQQIALIDPKINMDYASIAFSPDGTFFALTPGRGGKEPLTVWEAATGKLLASIKMNATPGRLLFSPDGSSLVFNADGTAIQVWGVKG